MADKRILKDLLEDEIKDLYSAEKQLTKAIPKMAKGAHRGRPNCFRPCGGVI